MPALDEIDAGFPDREAGGAEPETGRGPSRPATPCGFLAQPVMPFFVNSSFAMGMITRSGLFLRSRSQINAVIDL